MTASGKATALILTGLILVSPVIAQDGNYTYSQPDVDTVGDLLIGYPNQVTNGLFANMIVGIFFFTSFIPTMFIFGMRKAVASAAFTSWIISLLLFAGGWVSFNTVSVTSIMIIAAIILNRQGRGGRL